MVTIHPHDTDRILGVLGDAIEKLRELHYGYNRHGAQEIANDLALLHGAVSAERDRADRHLGEFVERHFMGSGHVTAAKNPDITVLNGPPLYESERRAFLRLVKAEEIQAEVERGEHREGD